MSNLPLIKSLELQIDSWRMRGVKMTDHNSHFIVAIEFRKKCSSNLLYIYIYIHSSLSIYLLQDIKNLLKLSIDLFPVVYSSLIG